MLNQEADVKLILNQLYPLLNPQLWSSLLVATKAEIFSHEFE